MVATIGLVAVLVPWQASGRQAACSPSPAQLAAPGCAVHAEDTAAVRDASELWRRIDCAKRRRHRLSDPGGDASKSATGATQGNRSFRRLKVIDGDRVYGERCELGRNDWRKQGRRTFATFREGERRLVFLSIRLPRSYPLKRGTWQVVMQMKQAQPSANGGGTPVLALEARGRRWRLLQSTSNGYSSRSRDLWSVRARKRRWTRFAFDVTFSSRPRKGFVKAYADLNGDGDARDGGEQSRGKQTYTLKREIKGGQRDGIRPGEPIPSHLRVGVYHNPRLKCRRPSGCAVDIDNVQVVSR